MALSIPMKRVALPESDIRKAKPLLGFDYGKDIFHVLCFDFGDDGGAVGIWREGDNFCARVSFDTLAEFWQAAKDDKHPKPDAGHKLHLDVLAMIEELMKGDPAPDSAEGVLLVKLSTALEDYEKVMFPFADPQGNAGVQTTEGKSNGL